MVMGGGLSRSLRAVAVRATEAHTANASSRVDLWKGLARESAHCGASLLASFPSLPHAAPEGLRKSGGRNNAGHVTSRYRGGGAKRLYRVVDFARGSSTTRGLVTRLEYDPNRSARIALVNYAAAAVGDAPASPLRFSYILAPPRASSPATRSGP